VGSPSWVVVTVAGVTVVPVWVEPGWSPGYSLVVGLVDNVGHDIHHR
jgi:hypothetical protein